MRFNTPFLILLSCTNLANAEQEKRETSFNMASALSAASVLKTALGTQSTTYSLPFVTPSGNLLQPPASLVGAIITAVPASVLLELAQPSLRSSIASEFHAGNTPMWYQTLPAPVKSYIESLNTQIAGGKVDLSATPSAFSFSAETSSVASKEGEVSATSTSKAIAAHPTGYIGSSLAAVAGLLGVVIVL